MLFHPDFFRILFEFVGLAALYLTIMGNVAFVIRTFYGRPSPHLLVLHVLAASVFMVCILAHLNEWWSILHTPRSLWNFGGMALIGLYLIRLTQMPARQY